MSKDPFYTSYENSPHREAPNKHIKGSKKYKEMIDKDSKRLDAKNLPFTISKPPKRTKSICNIYHICDNCQAVSLVSKLRVGQSCSGCKKYTSVNKNNTYITEQDLEAALERLDGCQE